MLLELCFLFFLSFSAAQKVIDLKSFRGNNVKNAIDNPGPYSMFVSAASDSPQYLNRVSVVSEDGSTQTMYEMIARKMFPTTGQLLPFPIQKSAYIVSNLTDDQMNTLTGFLFVSSSQQFADNNFYVIAVDRTQKLSWTGLGAINTTVLFLNSFFSTTPWFSSTINLWAQPDDAVNYVYSGFPTDTIEKSNSQIFSNPFPTTKGLTYISHVEQFSLSLQTFYIKSYKGVEFTIAPGYYDFDNKATSAYTTTGLYMKAINQPDKNVVIYTVRGDNYKNGTVGANVVGNVPDGAEVSVGAWDGNPYTSTPLHPVDQILGWSTQGIGQNFQIASKNAEAGEFYVQYYIIGPQSPSGSTPSTLSTRLTNPTTSRPIITTTKSSTTVKLLISLLIPFFFC